jgi:hypothetical protein
LQLETLPKAHTFMRLADNAFNYDVHGRRGFRALVDVVERSECLGITYSRLDDAIAVFERLCGARTQSAALPVNAEALLADACAAGHCGATSVAKAW